MISYLVFLAVIGGIYALLAQSVTLAWGMAGLVNLGLAGFFGIGAYASAMLVTWGGVPVPVGLVAAVIAGAVAGLVVTGATLRLRDDYLAIVTLGFAEAVRIIASNEIWLTGGTDGISGIPGGFPRDWGLGFHAAWMGTISVLVFCVWFGLRRLSASPWGRALRAIREDQTVAAVAGKPVARMKAEAFAIAAGIAALAGALYGHYGSYIAPELFAPLVTIYVFLAVTTGGNGRPSGAVLGGYLLIAFLEATRFAAGAIPGVTALQAAALREASVGVALILLLHWRPQGILPERNQKAPLV
ncbi:amino acid/amide ABC transporter membrane protein 2 (HAAT family) [Humitalea rosea]|uniref:Amino acid/amide ABC transporter membrane protein 2 (HAAT family) n=1 Tax=Humitalea rosea TaxID=990373 RepID=A0A2W7IDG2_9PROT|nr:branched-chain amino acid ABC transporter permease [Humitalea rosea]PZW43642.1 amino acid/amide ABC transporter membrane protein 2 (HAAT family) [Humitalea rosea]